MQAIEACIYGALGMAAFLTVVHAVFRIRVITETTRMPTKAQRTKLVRAYLDLKPREMRDLRRADPVLHDALYHERWPKLMPDAWDWDRIVRLARESIDHERYIESLRRNH